MPLRIPNPLVIINSWFQLLMQVLQTIVFYYSFDQILLDLLVQGNSTYKSCLCRIDQWWCIFHQDTAYYYWFSLNPIFQFSTNHNSESRELTKIIFFYLQIYHNQLPVFLCMYIGRHNRLFFFKSISIERIYIAC